jgi:hypothetical protein
VEVLERMQVRGDILSDRGVWATAGFDGFDPSGRESLVADEEFLILAV